MTYPREIEYFIAIVQEGNLTKAADRLCISQPALSKYLSKIENDVDSQLVIRNTTNIELTPTGKIYYDAVSSAYDILYNATKKIDDYKDCSDVNIIIGTPGTKTQRSIAMIAPKLFDKYPNLKLSTIEDNYVELKKMLKKNEIYLAMMGYSEEDPELEGDILYKTEIQLAVNKNHPLAKRSGDKISIQEVCNERFVFPTEKNILRKTIDNYLSAQGITVTPVIETKSKDSALLYVQAGAAIGFYPKEYNSKLDGIVYLDLKDPFYHILTVIHKKNIYLNAPSRDLIKLAKDFYKSPQRIEKLWGQTYEKQS